MKLIAAILFITFSAFSSEKIILPVNCPDAKKISKCSTCKKKMGMMMCSGKEKNKSNKSNGNLPQCLDCPLCVLMVHQPFSSFQANIYFVKTEYTIAQINNLADYHTRQWKPPNTISLS